MSFKDMKKNRKKTFASLSEEVAKIASGGREVDERLWKPTLDKAGNSEARIRWLGAPDNEDPDQPYVRRWQHFFKGKGGWYVELSRTSLKGPDGEWLSDPCGELNSKLWNAGDKKTATYQKRSLEIYSNILVIEDTGNPDNNGKVFLYKYGSKMFETLHKAMHPQFKSIEPIKVFDMWDGCDMLLKVYTKSVTINDRKVNVSEFDQSTWASPKTLGDDDEIEKIWSTCYSLQAFVDPSNFKSYDALAAKLARVLGTEPGSSTMEEAVAPAIPQVKEEKEESPDTPPWELNEDEDDAEDEKEDDEDGMAFFKDLAK
jgi:hypothetical protein